MHICKIVVRLATIFLYYIYIYINKAAGARRKCILDAMAEYFMKLNECDETRKRHILPCIEDDNTIDEEEVCMGSNKCIEA